MKNKTVTIKRTLKALAITAFCFNFGVVGPTATTIGAAAGPRTPQVQKPSTIRPLFDKANLKKALHQSNASKYDTAIRNIAALESAPLKTEADVKKALDILQRNELDNSMLLGKGFTIAINVSSFKTGVQAEAKRLSSKVFVSQMRSKSLSISKIGGFNDLKRTLKQRFDGDSTMLKRVAARLNQASKQKGISFSQPSSAPKTGRFAASFLGGKSRSNSFLPTTAARSTLIDTPDASSIGTNASYGEPSQIDPITGSILVGIAMGAAAFLITEYAFEKKEDLEEDPETGVSQMGQCLDDAKTARRRCLSRAGGNVFAQAGCWAEWLIDEAACLLLPL
jgi:hypothetical protein